MVSSLAPQATRLPIPPLRRVIECIEQRPLNRNSTPWVVKTRGTQGRFILRLGLTAPRSTCLGGTCQGEWPQSGSTCLTSLAIALATGGRTRSSGRRTRGNRTRAWISWQRDISPSDRPASLPSLDGRLVACSLYDQGQGGRAEDARRRPVAEPHAGCALDRRHVGSTASRVVGLERQHALLGTVPTRLTD